MTLPLVVVIALLLGAAIGATDSGSGGSSAAAPSGQAAPLSASAPPRSDVDAAACAKVLAQLPVHLGRLAPRVVHTTPDSPFVVAWGDPAVVLRCGEDRPATLRPGSSEVAQLAGPASGPNYFVESDGGANVWTTIDRAAYIAITVPGAYQGGDVLPPLSAAIAKALPAVCVADGSAAVPLDQLCTRRK